MATRRIREFLDGNHTRYVVLTHSPAYTAQEVAASIHIPGRSLAKVVVLNADGRLVLAVVPATKDVNMTRMQELIGTLDVRLADEPEFANRFQGCKLGAMPPFGDLFGTDTYLDLSLSQSPFIAFNAGTHTDVIIMEFGEYRRLAKPNMARIAIEPLETKFDVAQI